MYIYIYIIYIHYIYIVLAKTLRTDGNKQNIFGINIFLVSILKKNMYIYIYIYYGLTCSQKHSVIMFTC